MNKSLIVLLGIASIIIIVQSCKKDKLDKGADKELYAEIKAGGFSYYQNGATLSAAAASPHGAFKLRFNAVALASLDSTGELSVGHIFPTGSVLVKEVYNGTNLSLYAIMKKDPLNSNAGNSWIWAELKVDGSAQFSTGKKGDGCISCHSDTPNRDLVRTFDFH